MSIQDYSVSFSLEVNVQKALEQTRQLQTVLYRTLDLARKLGLPENLDEGFAKMQRAIAIANQLRLTWIAMQAAMGPIGWALVGISAVSTLISSAEFAVELR